MERLWAIKYDYPGTTNGERVGSVYVVDIDHISPGAYSYSKDLSEASLWTEDEADRLRRGKNWPNSRLVPTTVQTPA